MMRLGLTALALTALCAQAADFYTGQAAWAVIGQSSFSSTDASISPVALSQGPGRLFVADAGKHLLTFDTSQLSQSRITGSNSACSVCIPTPVASITQPLLAGIATFSSNRNTVVAVSQQNHTLSIWRDVTQQRATKGPDLVLGKGNDALSAGEPISVAYDGKRLFVGDAS